MGFRVARLEPGGSVDSHVHSWEESLYVTAGYRILDGEVEAFFDGTTYRLGPGDVAWAGVGCVHEFRNIGSGRVRWLETQAPQPPPRHSYRFARDWRYLADTLTAGKHD